MCKLSLTLGFLVVVSLPVVAQEQKASSDSECADRFKAADRNNDGVLTITEIPNFKEMPPSLAKESLVSRHQFIATCAKMPPQAQQFDKPAPPSPHSTGQTQSPETKGQKQPQGHTGPVDTKSGGAPAESPQGQTPPGMQSAPGGSSKTIVDPEAKGP